jgi:hypothetical protein
MCAGLFCAEKLKRATMLWLFVATGVNIVSRNTVGPPLSATKPSVDRKGGKLGMDGVTPCDEKGE